MSQALHTLDLDIALIGGGVAGLWLLNRLRQAGYRTGLFEHRALGSDQTIASQGMIHGGLKYSLTGSLSGATRAIAEMPDLWRACLAGDGELDLRGTRVLSDHFYLWSTNDLGARLTGFFASRLLHGHLESLGEDQRPRPLGGTRGNLYRLTDLVLDIPSLLASLAEPCRNCLGLIDSHRARLVHDTDEGLSLQLPDQHLKINARRFILCAGQGNGPLLASLGIGQPAMQLRPLQQVMVTHPDLPIFYGHCLGTDTSPRLTLSTHWLPDGQPVWYLGGNLAEHGAEMPAQSLIARAQAELASLLPQVSLDGARWATLPVMRAEARQPGLVRPDNAFTGPASGLPQLLVAWPTKLTLAPALARDALALLDAQGLIPTGGDPDLSHRLPVPPLAPTPWAQAFAPPALSREAGHAL